ncbi:MAG: Na+/H+ antiporter subunit E [Desulfurococcales archaeon]|nr:Na+/H+ antiporter subunit E [Desulfurococcales archaeon]
MVVKRIAKAITPAIVAFLTYVIFSGSVRPYDVVTGIIVAIIAGVITAEMLVKSPSKALNPVRLFWLIAYGLYYLIIAEPRAHYDVAKRIINPKMPIRPGIVRVPFNVKTDYAATTIANSITNTPGTVVVDLNTEKQVFYVHWIDVKAPDPKTTFENISKTFEYFSKKVFE